MRVLIADDDPTSRLLLKAMVSKLGHEFVVAEDGSSAWDVLASGGIDVLLTDWMMPGVDGPELCRRLRNEVGGGYIYIVLTTGLDHPEDVLEGMSAGADDYLTKPVDKFAVQTRLVAAERVTELHGQLAHTPAQLEQANLELLEQSLTDQLTGLGNRRRMDEDLDRVHALGAPPWAHLRGRHLRHRLLQAVQRPLRARRRRRRSARCGLLHRADRPRRVRLPVRRRGIPRAAARLWSWRRCIDGGGPDPPERGPRSHPPRRAPRSPNW